MSEKDFLEWLNTLTTAAEPIKHGRWIPTNKGDCTYTCSECGFFRDAYLLDVEVYCPNCGAKMLNEAKE